MVGSPGLKGSTDIDYAVFGWNVDISIKTALVVLTIRRLNHVFELWVMIFRWWKKASEILSLKPSSTWSIQTGVL